MLLNVQSRNKVYFEYFIWFIFLFSILAKLEYLLNFNWPILRYLIIVSSALILLLRLASIKNIYLNYQDKLVRILIILLLVLNLRSIFIAFDEILLPDRNYLNFKLFIGYKILLGFIPFILIININYINWKLLIRSMYILLILSIPIIILESSKYSLGGFSPENTSRVFAGGAGFLLLISSYFRFKKRIIILVGISLSIFLMLVFARRNMVLYFGSYVIIYLLIILVNSDFIIIKRRITNVLYLFLFSWIVLALIMFFGVNFNYFLERSASGLDNREWVFEEFFIDFNNSKLDFLLGRGLYGTFFSDSLGFDSFGDVSLDGGERDVIENGFLQIILNNGFIYICSFLLLSLISAYKGFFNSKNLFSKVLASVILINIVDMIGWGLPYVCFKYLIVWVSILVCFSREFRIMSDKEISLLIE